MSTPPPIDPSLHVADPRETGVRRLNKKPLLIVALGLGLIAIVVISSISKRGKAQAAAANPKSEKMAVTDTKQSLEALTKGAPSGLIPELLEEPESPDESGTTPRGGAEKGGTAATHSPAVQRLTILPDGSLGRKKELTEEEEEMKRILTAKRQAYEAAVNSPSTVTSGVTEIKESGSATDRGSAVPPNPMSALTDALQSRIAALGGGSGGGAETADPNGQAAKQAFAEANSPGKFGYTAATRTAPISPFEMKAGTIIPGVLISGINSDLPGMIVGQVSQDVYDTATGDHLLIPRGTKIVGSYDSAVTFGQDRALVAWNKLVFPDASTLSLGTMSGADQGGYSGFADRVNRHYLRAFGSALMVSLFSAGIQLSQPESDGLGNDLTNQEILSAEIGRQMGQLGMELARKNMNVQPTITIRPGYRFAVMVNKDFILKPYAPMTARFQ